jgi:hypothetical protein
MARWLSRLFIALGVVIVLAVAGIAYVVLSDRATPVDVEDAVDRYRDEQRDDGGTSTTEPEGQALPAEGVYVYATEGSESVDVLSGSTHRYPVETTLTITHTRDGLLQRWSPIEERWDEEAVRLTDGGRERRSLRTHHAFFGMSDDQSFSCAPGYALFPARPEPGETWSTACESDAVRITGTGAVVGFETLAVAGEAVDTVHVRIEERATGTSEGPSSDDYWLRTSDGLLIKRTSRVDSTSDTPVGTTTYAERFTLQLT